jgi:predicted homoserine dehydrogenase-like protein
LLGLNEKIMDLARHGRTINVAVVGLGQMGLSLASHLNELKGFKLCAVADKNIEKVNQFCGSLGLNRENVYIYKNEALLSNDPGLSSGEKTPDINNRLSGLSSIDEICNLEADFFLSAGNDNRTLKKINSEIEKHRIVFTNDYTVFSSLESIDVVVDATGYPQAGAGIAFSSILGGKDMVMLNVETDVTIGPILKEIAARKDAVYTLSAGDEPAVLKELYDFAEGLGLKTVCAGKGKNNPLNVYANPTTLAEYAAKKGSSAKMMTSFVDGTKSMVEMACLSNATGLVPDCRGMHGPKANIRDIPSLLCSKRDGGILDNEGVVDFVIGDLAPGVFLVYSTKNKLVKDVIEYLNLGSGPNYLIYKPYHLTSIETPLSVALAYFERQPWIVPMDGGLVSEVITVAKKDLKTGEEIGGIGGYTVYGLIEQHKVAADTGCLPIGLSQGCILKRNKPKDSLILYDDVEFPYEPLLLKLRKIQDKEIQRRSAGTIKR